MELCPQCRKAMEEGYVLRANTYGTIRVERGIAKKGGVRAAVCPSCGMLGAAYGAGVKEGGWTVGSCVTASIGL